MIQIFVLQHNYENAQTSSTSMENKTGKFSAAAEPSDPNSVITHLSLRPCCFIKNRLKTVSQTRKYRIKKSGFCLT
jgi:hypothetical protein